MLDTLILDTIRKQGQIQKLQNEIDATKKEINTILEKRNSKKYTVECLGKTYTASKVERITINYEIDKLKESLNNEILNEVIDKKYIIINMPSLKGLLKKYDVPAKAFRKTLLIEELVNRENIKRLFDMGEVTKEDLKGCYTAKLTKTIQLRESE